MKTSKGYGLWSVNPAKCDGGKVEFFGNAYLFPSDAMTVLEVHLMYFKWTHILLIDFGGKTIELMKGEDNDAFQRLLDTFFQDFQLGEVDKGPPAMAA